MNRKQKETMNRKQNRKPSANGEQERLAVRRAQIRLEILTKGIGQALLSHDASFNNLEDLTLIYENVPALKQALEATKEAEIAWEPFRFRRYLRKPRTRTRRSVP
jgi:hypothetical protein